MSTHARKGWTFGQAILAAACIAIGVGIAAFGFIDLYLTITHLIFRWWGSWAWTVILLGEGAALGAYLAALLADLRLTRPPAALRVFLAAYLALFVMGSLTLMVSAGWGSAPDLVSHAIVPISFFGYLLLAKVLVRHLSADPPTVLDDALADARRYAMDVLRDRKGIAWRWRPSVPSLLRRQVLKGRLKASVVTAVRESLREYGEPWEGAVREWVLGPDGLNLSAQAEKASREAAESIRQSAPAAAADVSLEAPAVVPAGGLSGQVPRQGRQRVSQSAVQQAKRLGRRASEDLLLEAVRELFVSGAPVTKYRIVKELPVGDEKAGRLLDAVRAERPSLAVAR